MAEYTPLSRRLLRDSQSKSAFSVGGKMWAGTVSVDDVDEAIGHVLLVDTSNNPILTGSGMQVVGPTAHDATATGNPLQLGGVAETTTPTAVADGDTVRAFFDALGQLGVRLHGTDGALLLPDRAAAADATTNPTLSKIGGYLHLFNGTTWDRARGDTTSGLDVDVTRMPTVSTVVMVLQNSSASSAQLLAANSARRGLLLTNTDANDVYVKFGTTASSTSFTVKIPTNGYWEMPQPIYTGRVDCIWVADGSGALIGSEL